MKKYTVYLILILLFALCLRVYRFESRIFFFSDIARDVLVAREAIRTRTIPPIASFSSAGPFVFGPQYYWLIMATFLFNPNHLLSFYYFLIIQSLLLIIVMVQIGKMMVGRKFGLFMGLIIALSPRQIFRSLYMTQHTIVAICAALATYFLIKSIKTKKRWLFFWCGFWVSTAISMHYQAMGLLIFGVAAFFIKDKIKNRLFFFIAFVIGAILPQLPLFIWDYGQQFANVRNLLDYLLIGQYRIYVPNRWLWHVFDFWPATFADLFGGNKIIGGLIIYFGLLSFLVAFIKRKTSLSLKFIFIIFIFFFIYLRYYRAEKFEGYLMYLHPLMFIIIAWGLFKFVRFKKWLWLFLSGVFIFNFVYIKNELKYKTENEFVDLARLSQKIESKVGRNKKLAVYDFENARGQTETSDFSETISLYLDSQNKLDYTKGQRIGFCKTSCPDDPQKEIKDKFLDRFKDRLFLISENNKQPLVNRSPAAVEKEVLFWWKEKPLKSPFNLGLFIYERTLCRNCHI